MITKLRKDIKAVPSFLDLTNKGKKRKDNKLLLSISKKLKVDKKLIIDNDNEDDNNNNNNNNNDNEPNLLLLSLKDLPTLLLNVQNIRPRRTIKTISKLSNPKILIPTNSTKLKYKIEEYSY